MNLSDIFSIGVMNLLERRIRSLLTILGIIIGIGAIVALISVGQGLDNALRDQFQRLGVSNIRIVYGTGFSGPPIGDRGLTIDDAEFVETVKGVDHVNQILLQEATVRYKHESFFLTVNAYETSTASEGFADVDLTTESGRIFEVGEKDGVILGYNIAHDRFQEEIRVKNALEVKNARFKVIGVFEKTGLPQFDDALFLPLETARILFSKPQLVNAILVRVSKGLNVQDVAETIRRRLERHRGLEDFAVFTPEQLISQIGQILGVLQVVLAGIAAISLVVGGIGIMNSLYTSVLERTREIGVMKAVGATHIDVLGLFLVEAGVMGLVGGALGIAGGMGLAKGVELGARYAGFSLLKVEVSVGLILFALLFAFFTGMVAGALPALRAARLHPVEALRYE